MRRVPNQEGREGKEEMGGVEKANPEEAAQVKIASRITKSFSVDVKDLAWFAKLSREAKAQKRSYSAQLVEIIKYYFEHQKLLRRVRKGNNP